MRRILLLLGASLACVLGWPATAGAGGWAVTTLDPVPEMEPGATVDIGFVVRQHGVRPIDLTGTMGGGGVGIEIVDASGDVSTFAAVADGEVGHHTATVTVPAAGTYEWRVLQGAFGPQDLGSLVVGDGATAAAAGGVAGPAAASGSTTSGWLTIARYGLPVVALLAAAYALGGRVTLPGRRSAAPAGA